MTWGELKKLIEDAGVTDEMEVDSIENLNGCSGPLEVHIYDMDSIVTVAVN